MTTKIVLQLQAWIKSEYQEIFDVPSNQENLAVCIAQFFRVVTENLNELDELIYYIEYFLSKDGQIEQGLSKFKNLWGLYNVKLIQNNKDMSNERALLEMLIKCVILDLVVVEKTIVEDNLSNNKLSSDSLINTLDDLLYEFENGNFNEVLSKWIEQNMTKKDLSINSMQVEIKVSFVHTKNAYHAYNEHRNDLDPFYDNKYADNDHSNDDDDDDDETAVCKLIRSTNLEEFKLSNHVLKTIKVTKLPNYELSEKLKVLQYGNDLNYNIFRDLTLNNSNKLVLLYGPPGSGKTSLSKSLSNALFINTMSEKGINKGLLIEISCAQLLSKYLNQSDKNIDDLFRELIKLIFYENQTKLYILIDEIETLVRCRNYLMESASPNSTLQMVNTMLVCLDRIRRFPNVIIFTTSNIINNIDGAFLDRVDLTYKVDKPTVEAIKKIIYSHIHKYMSGNRLSSSYADKNNQIEKLSKVCHKLEMSGRQLHKVCNQTHCKQKKLTLTSFLAGVLTLVMSRCRDVQ